MSIKKCIVVNCPRLAIILRGEDRGQFICKTESGAKLKPVLVSEIIEAGKEYNSKSASYIEPCSFWIGQQECSEEDYKKATRALWKKAQSLEM